MLSLFANFLYLIADSFSKKSIISIGAENLDRTFCRKCAGCSTSN